MEKTIVGRMYFKGPLDITEPGKNQDEYGRINGIPFREGRYICSVILANHDETDGMGKCVAALWIEPDAPVELSPKAYKKIGDVGVDAAMAGVFESQAAITEEQLADISRKIQEQPSLAMITETGFMCLTGMGDGVYPVFGVKNNRGEYIALQIEFL